MSFPQVARQSHQHTARSYFARLMVLALLIVASPHTLMAQPADTGQVYEIATQDDFDRLNHQTFGPGDRVLFRKGMRFVGGFEVRGAGTPEAPIMVSTFGRGGRPVIHAAGRHQAALKLINTEYCEVDGLEIINTDGSDNDQGDLFGIYLVAQNPGKDVLNHNIIRDCYVRDINGMVGGKRRGGIHAHVLGNEPTRFHDLKILDNRLDQIGGVGIGNSSPFADPRDDHRPRKSHYWTGMLIRGNRISYTGRNAIIARVSRDAIVERNTVAYSSRASTGHSIFCFSSIGMKIQYNEVYGNTGPENKDRGGFDADYACHDTYIQYNYSHDNEWFCGIMKRYNRGVTIRYNISVNERRGLYIYGFKGEKDAEDIRIYNNTHFVSADEDFEVFIDGRQPINSTIENNIFVFTGQARWGDGFDRQINTTFNNNLYLGIDPPESDDNAIIGNPRLARPGRAPRNIDWDDPNRLEQYRLLARSPAIDRGTAIDAEDLHDFWGSPVTGQPDIGAHERHE